LVDQTGASKIMHFKQPELFVMWDTAIRRHYRVPTVCTAEDYVEFLRCMRRTFGHLAWMPKDRTFAKAIDEYNFVLYSQHAKKEGKKSRNHEAEEVFAIGAAVHTPASP
jgi:hypothetical protein